MDATIEFYETVENVSIIFEENTDDITVEIIETVEVFEILFEEMGTPGKDADLSVLGNYERDWAQDFLITLNT